MNRENGVKRVFLVDGREKACRLVWIVLRNGGQVRHHDQQLPRAFDETFLSRGREPGNPKRVVLHLGSGGPAFFRGGEQNETESREDRKQHQHNQARPKAREIKPLHEGTIACRNPAHIRRLLKSIAKNSSSH
jgi:hypothetical protein